MRETKNLSLNSLWIAFVLYNLISEDILTEQSAKKTKTKNNPAGWSDLVSANNGLFQQHTPYQSWRMYSEDLKEIKYYMDLFSLRLINASVRLY